MSDYVERFRALTAQQNTAQAEVDRIGAERARVLAAYHAESGLSYAKIGAEIGLQRGTVQQLVERGRKEKTMQRTDITEHTVIYNGLSDGENAKWAECAEMWRFDAESHGYSVAITSKSDETGAPLVSCNGKTYVLSRYYEEGTNDWFIVAKPYTPPHER